MKFKHSLLFLIFVFSYQSVQSIENQYSLNNFLLHQFNDVPFNTLGKPIQAGETNYSTWEAFELNGEGYMLFEYLKKNPNYIYTIQITGKVQTMVPFIGLTLGDSNEKVKKVLGIPTEKKKVIKQGVVLWEYENKNYSVEIDNRGKLYSIRIHGYQNLINSSPDFDTYWEGFKNTVLNKNYSGISKYFRPGVEIYKHGKIINIDTAFHLFFLKPSKEFVEAIFSETDGVYKELKTTEPEAEIRTIEKTGVGFVHKFYKGKILEEIVFLPYANKYRIYEIKFR